LTVLVQARIISPSETYSFVSISNGWGGVRRSSFIQMGKVEMRSYIFKLTVLLALTACSSGEFGQDELGTTTEAITLTNANKLINDGRAKLGTYGGQCKVLLPVRLTGLRFLRRIRRISTNGPMKPVLLSTLLVGSVATPTVGSGQLRFRLARVRRQRFRCQTAISRRSYSMRAERE
jgi:hypothetical protein